MRWSGYRVPGLALALCGGLWLVAPRAWADAPASIPTTAVTGPPLRQATATAPHARWYGWQIVIADASTDALWITGAALGREHAAVGLPLFVTGLATYLIAPASLHVAHRNARRAVVSVALRFVGPAVTGSIGYVLACGWPPKDGCRSAVLPIGYLAGVLAAEIADPALLAYEKPPRARAAAWQLNPFVSPTTGGASVGLAGRF